MASSSATATVVLRPVGGRPTRKSGLGRGNDETYQEKGVIDGIDSMIKVISLSDSMGYLAGIQ